jgi:hypothetical protein
MNDSQDFAAENAEYAERRDKRVPKGDELVLKPPFIFSLRSLRSLR